MKKGITIKISDELWTWLNRQKKIGESFEDVLYRIKKLIEKFRLKGELNEI